MVVNVHMKSSPTDLTIGELATRFGLATHVLRHWESMGLLTPPRTTAGQRRYGPSELTRVAMILMSKEAGLTLSDLRTLLSTGNPMDQTDLLHNHLAVLDHRIQQAKKAKQLIEHALSCPLSFDHCPHAQAQLTARIPPT